MTAPGEPPKAKNGSSGGFLAFWSTLPGILTGIAALITAIVGLATLIHSWGGSNETATAPQAAATLTSTPASADSGTSGQEPIGATKTGPLALRRGDEADLERGVVGFDANSDIMLGPESTPWLYASNAAFLAPVQTMPSESTCRRALSGRHDPFEQVSDLSAPWVCVSTTEGHIAVVEIVGTPDVGSAQLDLKYTVWR